MNLKISKLDAAKRQLETAIRLYFSHADPVSVHTLTAAAYNILRDVTEQTGADPMLIKGQILENINKEYRTTVAAKINEAENFFKHADRDHDSTLDFDPGTSELLIVDACFQYKKLTSENPPLFSVYSVWLMIKLPKFFILTDQVKALIPRISSAQGRESFLDMALPLFTLVRS